MSRDAGPQLRGSKKWWEELVSEGNLNRYKLRKGYRRSLRSDYKSNPYKKFLYGDFNYSLVGFAHKWERRVNKKKVIQESLNDQ